MNELSEILEEKGRQVLEIEVDGRGRRGRRRLVKFKSKRQSFEIQYLTDYITAG